MSVRQWINENGSTATIAAAVMLVVAVGMLLLTRSGDRPQATDLYYYDLNTHELFIAPSNQWPPIEAPSGPYHGRPAGVRAHVFACGGCPENLAGMTADELEQHHAFIGYLDSYTPEAAEIMAREPQTPEEELAQYEASERGAIVRAPGENRWEPLESRRGLEIIEAVQGRCPDDEPVTTCYPGR